MSRPEDGTNAFGRYLEEFTPGEEIRHWPGKTITESDNNLFCLLTMNHHPVHLDARFAAGTQHGRILVVGTLVFSLAVGLTVRDISGRALANLGYGSVQHLAPVFIDDTLYVRSTILEIRRSRTKPDRGIVAVRSLAENQDGTPVLQFERSVLVPTRQR